jgi:flagellar protein FliO/FliZ
MKRLMFFFIVFLYLFSVQPTNFAANSSSGGETSVYETIQNGDKKTSSPSKVVKDRQSDNILPLFIKFIFSFVLVIALLILILRYLSKRNRLMQSNGLVLPLGTHPLGNNKSLQILLIGQTIYIVGVGESITLLRTISQGEEYQHLLEEIENQGEVQAIKGDNLHLKQNWTTMFNKHLKKIQRVNEEE